MATKTMTMAMNMVKNYSVDSAINHILKNQQKRAVKKRYSRLSKERGANKYSTKMLLIKLNNFTNRFLKTRERGLNSRIFSNYRVMIYIK